jgi:hypothetical protein
MRRIAFALLLPLLFAAFASAQVPSGNAFFGYSYYNTDLTSGNRISTNGWEASVEGKIIPFLGIVADFDSHYGSQYFPVDCAPACSGFPILPLKAGFVEHNYLFGPRVSVSLGKVRPFAEALIGAAHVNVNRGIGSDTSFATAVGGGLDYKLIPLVAWRLQGDYVHTSLFTTKQNNVRISTGIVVRF